MESANTILSMIVSVLTIIGAIFGFLLYFYNKAQAEVSALADGLTAAKKSITDLEKALISSSDSHLRKLLKQLSSRVSEIDEGYEEKIKKIKRQIESAIDDFESAKEAFNKKATVSPEKTPESPGKVIDLSRQTIQMPITSVDERLKFLYDLAMKQQKAIKSLRLVIVSHEEILKLIKLKD